MTATLPRTARHAVRMTAEQDALIRRAAAMLGSTLTDFTVNAAATRAQDVLADQRLFTLSERGWQEFNDALDAPAAHNPLLAKLLSRPSVFE